MKSPEHVRIHRIPFTEIGPVVHPFAVFVKRSVARNEEVGFERMFPCALTALLRLDLDEH
jgi:hypothetical protein